MKIQITESSIDEVVGILEAIAATLKHLGYEGEPHQTKVSFNYDTDYRMIGIETEE